MSLRTEIRANTAQATAAFKKFSEALDQVSKQGQNTSEVLNKIAKDFEVIPLAAEGAMTNLQTRILE